MACLSCAATRPEIYTWRRRWFVAENAVLWIHGSIPNGLRIELPSGPAPGRDRAAAYGHQAARIRPGRRRRHRNVTGWAAIRWSLRHP